MKLAVITGASAGIGLATAEAFLAAGYAVATLSRRPCPLAEAKHIPCDLAQPAAVEAAAETLVPLLEAAAETALVHNAAQMLTDTAKNTESDALRTVLEVNVVAAHALNRLALPAMRPGSCMLFVGPAGSSSFVSRPADQACLSPPPATPRQSTPPRRRRSSAGLAGR